MKKVRMEFDITDLQYEKIKNLKKFWYLDAWITGTYEKARVDLILRDTDTGRDWNIRKGDASITILGEEE